MTKEKHGISPNPNDEAIGDGVRGDEEGAGEEEDGDEGEAIECEICEPAPIRIARDPGDPTPEERETHNVTHNPYRPWCPICVEARGKEEAHRKQKAQGDPLKPTVAIDYKTFGQEIEVDDKATALVVKDSATKMNFAHLCEKKGSSDE